MSVIVAILALGFLVFFHELGHFIAAKACGVGVLEFSIGMGPRILSKVYKNTRYSLKALPFGGSCAMLGEDMAGSGDFLTASGKEEGDFEPEEGFDPDEIAFTEEDTWEAGERERGAAGGKGGADPWIDFDGVRYRASEIEGKSFQQKAAWQRFLICIAGVFNNFLLAFLFSLIVIGFCGYDKPYIIQATEGAPSQVAGFSEGDLLLSIGYDGKHRRSISCFRELQLWLYVHSAYFREDTVLEARFRHGNEVVKADFLPFYDEAADTYRLGIVFAGGFRPETGIAQVLSDSLGYVRYNIFLVIDSLHLIARGRVKRSEVMGPVGAVTVISDTVEESSSYGLANAFFVLLELCTVLSANLGVMNLLPVPALDGGRLLFILLEMISRRRLPPKLEERINIVGMVLILILMVLVLSNDLYNLFTGAYQEMLHGG